MKRNFLLLAILLPILVFSQKLSEDFTVTTSKPYKVIDATKKEYISLDNGYALMVKVRGKEVHVQKFNVDGMEEVARNTYEDFPKKAYFQDLIKFEDRVYYIFEAYNKKQKNFTVYSREINTSNATFEKQIELFTTKRKVVASTKNNLLGLSLGFGQRGNKFLISKSFDESKVMIYYRLYPLNKSDKNNFDEIGFHVFDNNMQKIWGKTVTMKSTEAEINNVGYALSSKGTALMLVAHRVKKIYQALYITKDNDLNVTDLEVETDKFITNLQIREDKQGNFVCGGYYTNGIEFKYNPFTGGSFQTNVNGLIYLKFDNSGRVITNKTFDFSKEFIQQNLSDRQKKGVAKREAKGKAGIIDLILLDFIVKSDGSVVYVGEREYYKKEFWGPQQKMVYHYSNVVVAKVDNKGELVWMKKIAKNQAGLNGTGQMSIAYMEGDKADYVAYVDNPKNIALSADAGVPSAHKDGSGGFLTTTKINMADGKLERHTICELKNIKGIRAYQFKAYRILNASDGNFLMEVYIKGKKDAMVKFKLK